MPYTQVKDLELYYEKLGSGAPILFLHSSYSRGILSFASQILDFQQEYTCYFPDFRGHGRTRCESLEWSTPQIAEDMIAWMDQLQLDKVHLVGYSLGANVGLYLAALYPERVRTLATIGTGGFCDPTGADDFEPEQLIASGNHVMIDQMLERHQEAHRGNWQEYMRQSARDWRLYPQLTEQELSGISCPCLFITGEHDSYAGEEGVKHLSGIVKGSDFLVVQGSGHRPHMLRDSPVLVNDAILSFLAKNSDS